MTAWVYAAAVVACGVGSAVRYALGRAPDPQGVRWPTIAANAIGCAVFGAAATAVAGGAPDWVLVVVGAGLAGGLTTFSALALDAADLWAAGRRWTSVAYSAVTIGTGLTAAAFGWLIGA